jgi:hypothetical protein
LYEASINKKKYNTLSTEIFCVLTPINGCWLNLDFLCLNWFWGCSFYNYWNSLNFNRVWNRRCWWLWWSCRLRRIRLEKSFNYIPIVGFFF